MNEEIVFRRIYEYMEVPVFVVHFDAAGDFVIGGLNPACEKATGLREETVVGKRPEEIPGLSQEDAAALRMNFRQCIEVDEVISYEDPFLGQDQGTLWLTQLTSIRDKSGQIVRIIGSSTNITEWKQAEEALKESEERFRTIVKNSTPIVFLTDQEGRVLLTEGKMLAGMGLQSGDLVGKSVFDLWQDYPAIINGFRMALSGELFEGIIELDELIFEVFYFPHKDLDGNTIGVVGMGLDITERTRTEDALRHSEEEKTILNQIAKVFLTIPDEAMYSEVLTIVLQVMKSKFGIFGYIGENGDLIIPSLTRDIWDECQVPGKSIVFPTDVWGNSLWGRAIREKKAFYSDGPFRTPEGHIHVDHFFTVPIVYRQETIGVISVANKEGGYGEEDKVLLMRIVSKISPILQARLQRDIQERKRMAAERAMKESEEKYRLLITNADEAIFIVQDEAVKFPNPKTLEMTGYSAEELTEIPFIDLIHPEDQEAVFEKSFSLLDGVRRPGAYLFRIIDKNGNEMWVQLTTARIIWDKKPGMLCFLRDVTAEKKLEAQFMQAQKMEAVGRLAGGVAHDFNNMLGVIVGHTDLALTQVSTSDPLYDQLQEIDKAARRSINLTRQLLAFARKQTIAPKTLNLNNTVPGLLNMLRRIIGEDIDLVWKPGADLWPIKMDSSQIDQVLANLCVNARDAIDGVGKVTIQTGNMTFDKTYCASHADFLPGEYIQLAVSDDGCGMDEETQAHLFEPFFTTKGISQGTGLGMATVYGIVMQNDGFINVYSALGQGTTFNIYFPRHNAEPVETPLENASETPQGGREIILVVEDEKAILDLGKRILEKLGYTVLTAKTPGEAIRLVEKHTGDIHLLLTDVVMPEMNGRDLAQRLASIKPGLKYLYMSGYTADVIAHRGVLEEGVCFIQKPFSMKDLAAKVHEVLDQKPLGSNRQ